MKFQLNADQEALAKSARRYLDAHAHGEAVRAAMVSPSGLDEGLWHGMTQEMGWGAVTIPARYEGFGMGQVALMCLLEAMGRRVVCSPYFASIGLAANGLMEGGSELQKKTWLPSLASGARTATLAWQPQHGGPEDLGVHLARGPDGWGLSGSAHYVVDGGTADLVVLLAHGAEGPSIVTVEGDKTRRRAVSTLDGTRRLGVIDFDGLMVAEDAVHGIDQAVVLRIFDRARVALCAEMVGGADRCLELAVEYAKERIQFGRPIGSFQAIKHKCADLLVLVESARSALCHAAWAADHDPDGFHQAATVAKAYISDAYFECAAENIQIHGGIGFTAEHDAHLFLKRARASAGFLGDSAFHYARAAGMVL